MVHGTPHLLCTLWRISYTLTTSIFLAVEPLFGCDPYPTIVQLSLLPSVCDLAGDNTRIVRFRNLPFMPSRPNAFLCLEVEI